MSRLHKFDYRIKDNRKRNTLLVSICLLILIVVGIKLYKSYAKFEVESDSYEMINGTVVEPVNAVEYLSSIVDDNATTMFIDDTPDENIRYMGSNPNNYVKFNNELWRIIGVMNNVDGGEVSGDRASRVKLIRNESLGRFPYYDSCADENWTNSGDGTYICSKKRTDNNWTGSTINEILTTYYNNGTYAPYHGYMYINNKWVDYPTNEIDYTISGIRATAKKLIESATYYLGGYLLNNNSSIDTFYYQNMNCNTWYNAERKNNGTNNSLTWTGNLGLMYISDYGYATNGGSNDNKLLCSNYSIYSWSESEKSFCVNNDWIHRYSFPEWSIVPLADSNTHVASVSNAIANSTYHGFETRPVVYLKSTVKIIAGPNSDGSASKPYKLTI